MPNLTISVVHRNPDVRSRQIQCQLRIKNESQANIRLLSIRSANAVGAQVQQVLDSGLVQYQADLKELYRQLRELLELEVKRYLAEAQSKTKPLIVSEVAGKERLRESEAASAASRVQISDSNDAESYYHQFVAGRLEAVNDPLIRLKIDSARRLEARLGYALPSSKSGSAPTDEYITDIEPGVEFIRDYVITCRRNPFEAVSYIMQFECRYALQQDGGYSPPMLGNQSFTGTVAPNASLMALLAAVFSVLGVALKVSLELTKDGPPSWAMIITAVYSAQMLVSLAAAAVTAFLFYHVYERTEFGRRVNTGVGWGSALLIGGISGLLNDKVINALEDLFG
jgi:hypothetical protein